MISYDLLEKLKKVGYPEEKMIEVNELLEECGDLLQNIERVKTREGIKWLCNFITDGDHAAWDSEGESLTEALINLFIEKRTIEVKK